MTCPISCSKSTIGAKRTMFDDGVLEDGEAEERAIAARGVVLVV